ncbi:hypothetical protein C6A85_16940, partial [Mycobacterium sp. ITM-2017-0098]
IVIRLDDNDAVSDRIDHRGDIAGASCQFGEMVLGMKGLLKVRHNRTEELHPLSRLEGLTPFRRHG